MARDPSRVMPVSGSLPTDAVRIFSAAGKELGSDIDLLRGTRLVFMDWTEAEELVCVFQNGRVVLCVIAVKYDVLGEQIMVHSLLTGASAGTTRVTHAALQGGTLAAVLGNQDTHRHEVVMLEDVSSRDEMLLHLPGGVVEDHRGPTCVAVLDPQCGTVSGRPEVLLATQDASIVVTGPEMATAEDHQLEGRLLERTLVSMTVSPDGKHLACMDETGVLVVLRSDFSNVALQYNAYLSAGVPSQIAWASNEVVALVWPQNGIYLVSYNGSASEFPYIGMDLFVTQEYDCLRVVTEDTHEIIQQVPSSLAEVYSVGRSTPGRSLLFTFSEFQKQKPECEDELQRLKSQGELADAISQCLNAAQHESDVDSQKHLLRAASFGLHACPEFNASEFVEACRVIRVLHNLTRNPVGLPLTVDQYRMLSHKAVVDRLVARRSYGLALQLCEFLSLPRNRVLEHWARAKVANWTGTDEDELVRLIVERLGAVQSEGEGISFASIAEAAEGVGASRLATKLLEYETRPERKVPLLLKMRHGALALRTALLQGDTETVQLVLMTLKIKMVDMGDAQAVREVTASAGAGSASADGRSGEQQFIDLVGENDVSLSLMVQYLAHENHELLLRLLERLGRWEDAGLWLFRLALDCKNVGERLQRLEDTQRVLQRGIDAGVRSLAFHSQAVRNYISLLEHQEGLVRKGQASRRDLGRPAASTACALLVDKREESATQLMTKLHFSDAQSMYVRVQACVAANDGNALRTLGRKKSPIGYKPFVHAALQLRPQDVRLAEEFVDRVSKGEEQYIVARGAQLWSKAGEIALRLRDRDMMEEVLASIGVDHSMEGLRSRLQHACESM